MNRQTNKAKQTSKQANKQTTNKVLVALEALDPEKKRITELGKIMNMFPIAPRFAKMSSLLLFSFCLCLCLKASNHRIALGDQKGCLPYVIALVSALTVGDPFIRDLDNYIQSSSGLTFSIIYKSYQELIHSFTLIIKKTKTKRPRESG